MTRIAIVGGGINGLVAANYLARGGADVTLHERRAHVGGACVSEAVTVDGIDYEFPLGATVLGFMQDFGYPVVLDVTHSLQLPSLGRETGGERRFAALLARAGVAAGVDVLFIEVHDEPERAVSDATTQLPLAELDFLLASLRRVHDAVQADGARRSS